MLVGYQNQLNFLRSPVREHGKLLGCLVSYYGKLLGPLVSYFGKLSGRPVRFFGKLMLVSWPGRLPELTYLLTAKFVHVCGCVSALLDAGVFSRFAVCSASLHV